MKIIKRILFALVGIIMAACLGILICALNPSMTDFLAQKVKAMQGGMRETGGTAQEETRAPGTLPEAVPGINPDWMADREDRGYLVPGEDPGEPPSAVNGRAGYEPVNGEAQPVLEEESDTLAPGELGEGLTFAPLYYPYYAMLEAPLQNLYRQIYANASQLNASFTPVEDVDLERLKRVFEAVYNDHPELFWLETGFSCKYLEDGTCVEITLKYNETAKDLAAAREIFVGQAEKILSGARALGSDYQREKYVHDALAEKVEYDLAGMMNQSAYSGLVTARTVCAGYSRAFQYLLQQLGIPCYYCTGSAGENHAWNIVCLNGEYYNADVTWDDTDELTYDYFNRTDAEFAPTHVRTGLSVYLPACMGTAFRGGDAEQGTEETGEEAENTETEDGEAGNGEPEPSQEPMKPLQWVSPAADSPEKTQEEREKEERQAAEEERRRNLEEAGITEEEVLDTMEEYFEDCREQMKIVGVGECTFSNVVPASLYPAVERCYTTGSYWNDYADESMKDLGVDHFLIQLQVQDLGGGFYRVYHNVLTY